MTRRIPSIAALSAFEAAAKTLHFSRAAERLAVTPGAVSRQILGLEAELGVRLFNRHSRNISLTELGKAYASEIADALDRLESASARIRGRTRSRPLSICAYPSFTLRWLIPRWRKFHDLYPQVDLQLTTSLSPDNAASEFDAVVQVCAGEILGHSSVLLAPIEMFPVCNPDMKALLKYPVDLAAQTLLHSAPRPNDWPRWLSEAGLAHLIDPAGGPKLETLSLAYQAALEGVGVAMGLGCLVADDISLGRLVRPINIIRRSRLAFYLVYPSVRKSHPGLAALSDFLKNEASGAAQLSAAS